MCADVGFGSEKLDTIRFGRAHGLFFGFEVRDETLSGMTGTGHEADLARLRSASAVRADRDTFGRQLPKRKGAVAFTNVGQARQH